MAKIIRVILFFLFIATVGICSTFDARIKNFDDKFLKANKTIKLELHQDMKGLYIKSVIDNDDKIRVEILKRLIESSKALGLGSNPYERELESLVQAAQKDSKNNKKLQKESKGSNQPLITAKENYSNKSIQILKVIEHPNGLEIKFSSPIFESSIKHFKLNSKNHFRNVYDLNRVWISKPQAFKNIISDEIKVSQFDKNTIRVVFSHKKEQKINFKIKQNSIFFALDKVELENLASNSKSQQKTELKDDKSKKQNSNLSKKIVKTKISTSNKIIVLDAGHGGDDPGAIGGAKLKEKNIVLSIALKAGDELKKRGYKVYYTRTKDKFINLRSRTKLANDKLADLFISVHANAAPNKEKGAVMQGIETFFLSPARSERSKNVAALENKSDIDEMNFFSKQTFLNFLNREKIIASNKLAIDIQREVLARTKKINSKVVDGGVREAPFWVLVGALMPAVLLEVGYISHPDEGKLIGKSNYQDAIAKGIADGVDVYFANQQ
ncbi:N-acetylmuramoyl-L-alanine amidase [Campylobacter sp. RM16187]|nr:N-acetylmuramoyl-L-alanine amidase [Campylobacter sp. RM16187]QKG28946.1 N-acetylmuramoyl-L-alanine amidase [Campylobacter sp. RM16187]